MTLSSRLTVAISGSRRLRDARLVGDLLTERAIYFMSCGYELHLHLGDAQGVDALAIYWARSAAIASRSIFFASPDLYRGFEAAEGEQLILAADWTELGFAAGPIRNSKMLSGEGCPVAGCYGADVLFAIRAPEAPGRNRGTDDCRAQARQRMIAVQTYTVGAGESEWIVE